MNIIQCTGLRPEFLSEYFCAGGLIRALSQEDPNVRGCWTNDGFVLHTSFTEESLVEFLMTCWSPSPIFSPWLKESGFFKDKYSLEGYTQFFKAREVETFLKNFIVSEGFDPDEKGSSKEDFIKKLRSFAPCEFLEWMDVVYSTGSEIFLNPFMWSGGNEGRIEFSSLFWGYLTVALQEGLSPRSFLFGTPECRSLVSKVCNTPGAPGTFLISKSGGYNRDSSFEDTSYTNPWEFVLMFEGTLFLQSSVSKKGSSKSGTSPFCFQKSKGVTVGHLSCTPNEGMKCEFWAPIWNEPASKEELQNLFSEGRVKGKKSEAFDSMSFSQSLSGLGVDRNISKFFRWGVFPRKGQISYSTLLGTFSTSRDPSKDILENLTLWFSNLSSPGTGKVRAIHSLSQKLLFSAIQNPDPRKLMDLFSSFSILSPEKKWNFNEWRDLLWDDSPEFRLALSVASTTNLSSWTSKGGIHKNLISIFEEFEIGKESQRFGFWAHPEDVQRFLEGRIDPSFFEKCILALRVFEFEFEDHFIQDFPLSLEYVTLKLAKILGPEKFVISKLLRSGQRDMVLRKASVILLKTERIHSEWITPNLRIPNETLCASLIFPVKTTFLQRKLNV